MAKKIKTKQAHDFKCSACINLIDGFRKSPCELHSKDLMIAPTHCVWSPYNVGENYTRAKWNIVKHK
jgi:hypothetical protein